MANKYPLVLSGSTIQELQSGDGLQLPVALSPAYGGTGIVNNAASTWAISGNYATTVTVTGVTTVTLPTSGVIATKGNAIAFSIVFGL